MQLPGKKVHSIHFKPSISPFILFLLVLPGLLHFFTSFHLQDFHWDAFRKAAAWGDRDLITWMKDRIRGDKAHLTLGAACNGDLSYFLWVQEQVAILNPETGFKQFDWGIWK
jgi:hypothetical protein